MNDTKKIIVVAGPTASGKSDFAVDLAKKLDGEIISADSRQIYKGLDIGTGKITYDEMQGIPHHMIDIIDIDQSFSVAGYQRVALPILEAIIARGKTPIICGGTGQYIDALIYSNTFPQIPPNESLRKEFELISTEELYQQLEEQDKDRAITIDKHNRVRLIRALEIIASAGKVPAQAEPTLRYPTVIYLLAPSKELLLKRIEKRLEKRLQEGMLEEGKELLVHHFSDTKIASLGLEYSWMNKYLTNDCSYEIMKKNIITKSWQYAKRQMTWNKKYLPLATIISPSDTTKIKSNQQ